MYLSRLFLNPRSRQVQREVSDPYQMHRTIMRAFPATLSPDERVLFRLEAASRGAPVLIVQSQQPPDWSWLNAGQRDYLLAEAALPLDVQNPAVKQVTLQLQPDQTLAFRLRANPTAKKSPPERKNGVRVGLVREEAQMAWLERKMTAAGSRLLSARASHPERLEGTIQRDGRQHELHYLAVQFEGLIQVQDAGLLLAAVRDGIGSAKGLGFGLLSLAPA